MGDPLYALLRAARDNAKHFPNDAVWQRHCKKVAEYLEAVSLKPEGKGH